MATSLGTGLQPVTVPGVILRNVLNSGKERAQATVEKEAPKLYITEMIMISESESESESYVIVEED